MKENVRRFRSNVVAVDLDGVLGDQVAHALLWEGSVLGKRLPRRLVSKWDSRVRGVPFDQIMARWLRNPEFVITMPVVRGARCGMDRLARVGRVVVLTKRPTQTARATRSWIRAKFGPVPRVRVLGSESKSDYPAQVLVDDNLDNLRGFVESDPTHFGVLFSRPWNRGRRAIAGLVRQGRVRIARNWSQVAELIEARL